MLKVKWGKYLCNTILKSTGNWLTDWQHFLEILGERGHLRSGSTHPWRKFSSPFQRRRLSVHWEQYQFDWERPSLGIVSAQLRMIIGSLGTISVQLRTTIFRNNISSIENDHWFTRNNISSIKNDHRFTGNNINSIKNDHRFAGNNISSIKNDHRWE